MVAPVIIAAGITAAGALASAYMNNKGNNKESKSQKTKRHLIDKLLSSLNGKGPYADLYTANDADFQKSIVEPNKAMFNNQIAPMIQQQYVASGQQRSSGLDDQLLRAGVDLDQLLNAQYMDYKNSALDRKQNAINNILGSDKGSPAKTSGSDALMQGGGGFLASDSFKDLVSYWSGTQDGSGNAISSNTTAGPVAQKSFQPQATRPGYQPDFNEYSQWNVGDKRWGN